MQRKGAVYHQHRGLAHGLALLERRRAVLHGKLAALGHQQSGGGLQFHAVLGHKLLGPGAYQSQSGLGPHPAVAGQHLFLHAGEVENGGLDVQILFIQIFHDWFLLGGFRPDMLV